MIKLTKEKIAQILFERFNGEFKKLSDIPSPTLFKDGVKGAKRVVKAINQKEKIVIVGDYDVDGIVSTTIISEFFEQINYPVDVIIPNRFTDGYGISTKIIDMRIAGMGELNDEYKNLIEEYKRLTDKKKAADGETGGEDGANINKK